jgi:hypothetical protein
MTRFVFSRLWTLVLLIALTALGCDSGDTANPWTDGDTDGAADGDASSDGDTSADGDESDTEGPIEADELDGVWGIKFAIAYTCLLPVFEKKVQMILTGVARLDFDQTDTDIAFTEEICDFTLQVVEEEDVPFIVIFPKEEIVAVPIENRMAALDALELGTRVKTSPTWDLYGADASLFDDPNTDPLPVTMDDTRLVNFGDDKPGVTARLGGMFNGLEVYVVLRMMRDMEGTLVTADHIEGVIASSVEMMTIGASNDIVKLQLDLVPHTLPELNRFEMVRLPDEQSCGAIFDTQDSLFSYDPFDYAVPFTYDD